MSDAPIRTLNEVPRITGRVAVYEAVNERLERVHVYVPFSASDIDTVRRTVAFALDTQPQPLPREEF